MRLITLYVPEPYLKALDQLIKKGHYPNRAEAIRTFIRDGLIDEGTFDLGDSKALSVVLARQNVAVEARRKRLERRRSR